MKARPHQAKQSDEIEAAYQAGARNVAAVLPTGGGKTFIGAGVIKRNVGPSCAIAHRQELVGQISLALAHNGVRHRIIGPDKVVRFVNRLHMEALGRSYVHPQASCAVAGVDTLVKAVKGTKPNHVAMRQWAKGVNLWMVDECFPAGTKVSGRAIETLKAGDYVTAFDEHSGEFKPRKVVRLFKNPAPETMVRLELWRGKTLHATQGHPFFTKRGWVEAGLLTLGDKVLTHDSRGKRWGVIVGATLQKFRDIGAPDSYVYNIEVEGWHTYLAEGVVVHNCHHLLKSNKWGTVTELFPNARGLGLTATPIRADGKGLGRHADGLFDTMVLGPDMRTLINSGYLTDYRIFAPPCDFRIDSSAVASDGDFTRAKMKAASKKSHIVGDVVDHYLKYTPGALGITFSTDVETATAQAAKFNAAGVPAAMVCGETPSEERTAILRKFARRELMMLVNVDLFGEGFDLPALEVVIMARPTQSYALYVQQFGRALRLMISEILSGAWDTYTDAQRLALIADSIKPFATIIDCVGNVDRHGLPDAPKHWSLDRRDRRSKTNDSDVIPTKSCPGCTRIYERIYKSCPYCSHVSVPLARSGPEFVDGDLTELDAATLAAMRGETAKVDMTLAEKRAELAAKHCPAIGQMAGVKRHEELQAAQAVLRDSIALWGGWQRAQQRPDSESYRRFYFRFGVDVESAKALGRAEAVELTGRIVKHLTDGGITT